MGLALEIKNVSAGYETPVLLGVSCVLKPGTITGVLGPNGAGKTTLLRAVSGEIAIQNGDILIGDRSLKELLPKERARLMAFVSQTLRVALPFSVRTLVEMGRTPYHSNLFSLSKNDMQAVENALIKTDTLRFADRSFLELSAGEQQRALLAMALAQETDLLLLDEPTSHLDIQHAYGFMNLLKQRIHEQNMTLLVSLHDLNLAARYCDSILLLNKGRLAAFGPPHDVMKDVLLSNVYEYPIRVEPRNDRVFIIPD